MTLSITIHSDLTLNSQQEYREMTRDGAAVRGGEMRSAIQDHYGLEGGRFNHKIISGKQRDYDYGFALVRASVGSTKNALYFILGYDGNDSIECRAGYVHSVHTTLEAAQEALNPTETVAETVTETLPETEPVTEDEGAETYTEEEQEEIAKIEHLIERAQERLEYARGDYGMIHNDPTLCRTIKHGTLPYLEQRLKEACC